MAPTYLLASASRSHTVDIDLDSGTPAQQLYVHSFRFDGISHPLDQSCETIRQQLSSIMIKLLVKERDGG